MSSKKDKKEGSLFLVPPLRWNQNTPGKSLSAGSAGSHVTMGNEAFIISITTQKVEWQLGNQKVTATPFP